MQNNDELRWCLSCSAFFIVLRGNGMIHFMVDWENVNNKGLKGYQFLTEQDAVTIFYSNNCNRIIQGELQGILSSGVKLQLYKLVNPGKNALDHYISSRIGELYGSGYQGEVAIVSKDRGYKSVRDYWEYCAKPNRRIILQENLELCILYSKEKSERKQLIQKNIQVVNLEQEYEKYCEHNRIYDEMVQLFLDTEYQLLVPRIMDIIEKRNSNKVIYLNTLKEFGKKDGLEIYRTIRQWQQGR